MKALIKITSPQTSQKHNIQVNHLLTITTQAFTAYIKENRHNRGGLV